MTQRVLPPFSLSPRRQGDRQTGFGFGDSQGPPAAPPPPPPPPPPEPKVFSVSDLVRRASRALEDAFTDIWVEGEVEGLKPSASGHLYFALKDGKGRIDAVIWRGQAQALRIALRDGMKLQARGKLTIYEGSGRFQMIVSEVRLSGEGDLWRQFEELKARLQREGLFETARKRPLPRFPRVIGVATSQQGAALYDILRVARSRGRVHFLIAHCAVQGPEAPPQIVDAIRRLAPHVDVMIVGRGGGSLADLWSFNDESVARAIYHCPVPVVSAVGHEVDTTIADFVADRRAATPSQAAEICVPDFSRLEADVADLSERLLRSGQRVIDHTRQKIDGELQRAQHATERQIAGRRRLLSQASERLQQCHPRARLLRDRAALHDLITRLHATTQRRMLDRRQALASLAGKLDAMSPLKVLGRGYALARDERGHIVTTTEQVAIGDRLDLMLSQGNLRCRVEDKDPRAE